MQNAGVEFVRVGQAVEFGGVHKQAGNRFGEAETGTKGKTRMPGVWRTAAAPTVFPETLTIFERILRISNLLKKFHKYMRLNGGTPGEKSMAETGKYRSEYFNSVGIPVPKFQEEGMEEHHVRWTGVNEFRNRGEGRVD